MSDQVLLQYVGFEVKSAGREYTFAVREAAKECINYTLSICDEAFTSHRVRYQDAAEICAIRLRRELRSDLQASAATSFSITDDDLAVYRTVHTPKASRGFQKPQKE
jgi:hypothetical protein